MVETIQFCAKRKMSSGLFKMLSTNYAFTNRIYLTYMYKQDLALKKINNG